MVLGFSGKNAGPNITKQSDSASDSAVHPFTILDLVALPGPMVYSVRFVRPEVPVAWATFRGFEPWAPREGANFVQGDGLSTAGACEWGLTWSGHSERLLESWISRSCHSRHSVPEHYDTTKPWYLYVSSSICISNITKFVTHLASSQGGPNFQWPQLRFVHNYRQQQSRPRPGLNLRFNEVRWCGPDFKDLHGMQWLLFQLSFLMTQLITSTYQIQWLFMYIVKSCFCVFRMAYPEDPRALARAIRDVEGISASQPASWVQKKNDQRS